MLDVARDPRWGRIAEGRGRGPCGSRTRMAEAKVRGFQGDDPTAPDSRRRRRQALRRLRRCQRRPRLRRRSTSRSGALHEIYLPPFRAAVEAGRAGAHAGLQRRRRRADDRQRRHPARPGARARWGFDGLIVSDYNAIAELMNHGVAGDLAEAAALALKAGVDIDMMGGAYAKGLPGAARARPRHDGRHRRLRAPRAPAEGAPRPVRGPLPRGRRARPLGCQRSRPTARSPARPRAARSCS